MLSLISNNKYSEIRLMTLLFRNDGRLYDCRDFKSKQTCALASRGRELLQII